MVDHIDTLRRTRDALVEQRRHIDDDIADLNRIIARHDGTRIPVSPSTREEGRVAPPSGARWETLELLGNGAAWTPGQIARRRGVSANAVRALLRRMEAESPPPIVRGPNGYMLASLNGDAQESLSVAPERDSDERREGVDDVVSRAPA